MFSMKKVRSRYGGEICRSCLNKKYGGHLKPRNCRYADTKNYCPRCNEYHHIVVGLRPSGWIRMFFGTLFRRA